MAGRKGRESWSQPWAAYPCMVLPGSAHGMLLPSHTEGWDSQPLGVTAPGPAPATESPWNVQYNVPDWELWAYDLCGAP